MYRSIAFILSLFAGILSLSAQPVNVQQFQNTQRTLQSQTPVGWNTTTNAPELYPGEASDVGPQRILRLKPRPKYFNVMFDSQVFYSDNANFAEGSAIIGSAVFVNTAQGLLTTPEMTLGPGKFAPTAGYVSQWYNYSDGRMKPLDFNAQTAFVGTRYTYGNWQLGLGGNYTRLLNQEDYAQTYSEWLPFLTIQRIIPINDYMLFAVGNQLDYHFTSVPHTPGTSTEINNRLDNAVSLTFSWQLTQHLIFQPYYRFQYSNYRYDTRQTTDRNDYLNSFGLTLSYFFNQNLSVRTFFNYNIKNSDDSYTPAYHEYNGGLGANLNFSF